MLKSVKLYDEKGEQFVEVIPQGDAAEVRTSGVGVVVSVSELAYILSNLD